MAGAWQHPGCRQQTLYHLPETFHSPIGVNLGLAQRCCAPQRCSTDLRAAPLSAGAALACSMPPPCLVMEEQGLQPREGAARSTCNLLTTLCHTCFASEEQHPTGQAGQGGLGRAQRTPCSFLHFCGCWSPAYIRSKNTARKLLLLLQFTKAKQRHYLITQSFSSEDLTLAWTFLHAYGAPEERMKRDRE